MYSQTPIANAQIITEPLFKSVQRVEEPNDDEVLRRRVIVFQYEMMETLVKNPDRRVVASFELFDDLTVLAEGVQVDRWSANEYTWHGEFVERRGNMKIEVNTHEEVVFTSFQVGNYSYRINHLEDELYEVLELDLSGLQDHPPDWQDPIEEEPPGTFEPSDRDTTHFGTSRTMRPPEFFLRDSGKKRTMSIDDDDILDVLMVYTQEAADSAGGVTDMVLNIRNAFSNANASFVNSGVNARVRSVGIRGVTWDGDPDRDMDDLVNALESSVNDSDHFLHEWREEYGADIVGMVYSDAKGCGRVYEVMSEVTDDFRDKAVFVVKEGFCLGGNFSFVHEIGHLLGARHDWHVDDTDGSPFAYNHGYVHIDSGTSGTIGWRTIMAYNDECREVNEDLEKEPNCTRKNFWSSPNNSHNGDPTGVASGDEPADNVRALNNTIPTVSGFEDPAPVVYGIVTDLMSGDGMEEVEMAGIYGPVTDENGFYDAVVRKGKSVWLTPKVIDENLDGEEYEFDPSSPEKVENVTSNVQQNFNAGIYYNIAGRVLAMDDIDPSGVELTGAPGSSTPVTDEYGRYDFDVLANWEGSIIPQKGEEHEFDPPEREYSNLSSDLESEDYEMSLISHRITGTIEEAGTSQGIGNVVLEGLPYPFPPYVITNNAGGYTYNNLKHGWSGTIRPIRIGYKFEPATRSYDAVHSDINHNYTAIPSAVANSGWPIYGANSANSNRIAAPPIGDTELWSTLLAGTLNESADFATSPVIGDGGIIYTTSNDGTVYAFDKDGSELWKRTMGKGLEITTPPVAGSGRLVYVSTISENNSRIYQLEEEGSVRGFFSTNGPIHTVPATSEKDMLYIGSDDGHLYALRTLLFLDEAWSFKTGDMIRSSPAVDPDGNIYFGSDDGWFYALNPDGDQQWSFESDGRIRSAPTLAPDHGDNGVVYFGSDQGSFYALDMASGTMEWQFTTGGAIRSSAAIDSEDNLYFGSSDQTIYAVSTSGQQIGTYQTNGPVNASPAISQNDQGTEILYVGADKDRLYAFDLPQTQFNPLLFPLWEVSFSDSDEQITSVALSSDGELYFAHGTQLIALGGEIKEDEDDGDDSSQTQFAFFGHDPHMDLTLEDAHIIIWLSEQGGPLGVSGPVDPNNPCPPGPVYIPRCPNEGGGFGDTTPFMNVVAEQELVIGLASGMSDVDAIAAGRTTEGLLGTIKTKVPAQKRTTLTIGGVTQPESFAKNPNGRSTYLNAFTKTHEQTRNPDHVGVYAGNLSTDAPGMAFHLEGNGQKYSFENLRYGDFSRTESVPPGEYQFVMSPDETPDRTAAFKTRSYTVDLTDRKGEQIGLFATGFMDPSANNEGPGLNYSGVSSEGEIMEATYAAYPDVDLPQEVVLEQNYPNPFNPSTRIRYAIPEQTRVRLNIYNALGQLVTTLINENQSPGYHEAIFDASNLSSGLYISRLEAGGTVLSQQMMLVK